MILGRSWLFDKMVMHEGYLNTYTLSNDGKKISLAPLSPSQLYKNKSYKCQGQLDLFLTCGV